MSEDIRWKQRFQNFDRAFVLLREALEDGRPLSMLEKEGYDVAKIQKVPQR